jgi:hypothetical protein
MIPEVPPEQTDEGLVPGGGGGWFVLNARDVDEVARRYGASPGVDTQDADVAGAHLPESRYRDGWLPG